MITFTDRAREMVKSYLGESNGEVEALRIRVEEGRPLAPNFELTLVSADELDPADRRFDGGGFPVVVDPASAEKLEGAVVDFVERVNESGFEVRPQRPATSRTEATGEMADKVRSILNDRINPAVASHGGAIELVDVQGTEVFIEMTGGCQGCAMSRMTLKQGVERMIRDALPEVTAVHDATDHTSGANPYFT
jgi:Fe/S biogenesis protein NfuA